MLAFTDHDARRWEPKRLRLPALHRRRPPSPAPADGPAPPRHPITLGRAGRRRHRTGSAPSPPPADRRRALTRYRISTPPGPWNPAPTEATPGELSHPPGTIRPAQPASRRNHDQQARDESEVRFPCGLVGARQLPKRVWRGPAAAVVRLLLTAGGRALDAYCQPSARPMFRDAQICTEVRPRSPHA